MVVQRSPPPRQPLLAIAGATASGKSSLAQRLAEAWGAEILTCDSVQVYRGFEIGCAKPSAEQRARVPHHLLDVVEWDEAFDAQRYVDLAGAALGGITERSAAAILCGGTGLYLRALRYGLVPVPPADANLRASFEAQERAVPGSLYARLRRQDPESARTIEPNNLVQVIRALEIQETTGEPASVVRGRHGFREERVPMRVLALRWPNDVLLRRIVERTRRMIADGLLQEVATLLRRGIDPLCRPMRSVGYREASAVVSGEAEAQGLEERIVASTKAYARRQRTWLRREKGVHWIEAESDEQALDAVRLLTQG